jgi:SP family sugar:H+ symporter-like MFS transporter
LTIITVGGFILSYDTSQISDFLAMQVFKENFGELQSDGSYYSSDVRSGLVVAVVSDFTTDYAIKRLTIL